MHELVNSGTDGAEMVRRRERTGLPPGGDMEGSGEPYPSGMGDLRSTANSGLPPKTLPALVGEVLSGDSFPTLGPVELTLEALERSGES